MGVFSQLPTLSTSHSSGAALQLARPVAFNLIPAGGYTPGTILSDRYRIVGLLGRGGMGEIYRADDLKLGRPVALKVLSKALASDVVRRERFFGEVAIMRKLSHPNICRVYDVEEIDGRHFLSMEYVDGEDLASLLRRIGHLTHQRALHIARQIAAGLAAAHEKGVLHRGLKPADVIIDGHGRVRITGFGLAIAVGEEGEAAEIKGAPAYLAPEQFSGKGATTRSDIYAFGLILYEIYSGKRAFGSSTIGELRVLKDGETLSAPSEIRQKLDPVVEHLIRRCLERDPRSRPTSVAQLALALPGGNPLTAALSAGETPTSEMVAALGSREGLRPKVALALLAAVVLSALLGIWMKERSDLFSFVRPAKPPDVLSHRAQEIITKAGYSDPAADSASGFIAETSLLDYLRSTDRLAASPNRLNELGAVRFWYRTSPQPLVHESYTGRLSEFDPPVRFAGEVLVQLDAEGHLRKLEAMPTQVESSTDAFAPVPDWSFLFSQAGLDPVRWTLTNPQWNSPFYADTRAAWYGSFLSTPEAPVRIEAAAYRGKPVYFEVIGPWTRPARMGPAEPSPPNRMAAIFFPSVFIAMIVGAIFTARRNLLLGWADLRGARRLVFFILGLACATWVLTEHHVATLDEFYLFGGFAGWAVIQASLIWLFYIALEPFVRRRWPHILVSWTRLLSGEWRDPVIGTNVLVGCVAGLVTACFFRLELVAAELLSYPAANAPTGLPDIQLLGANGIVSFLLGEASADTLGSLGLLLFVLLLRMLVRRDWVAIAVGTIVLTAPALAAPTFLGVVSLACMSLLTLLVLMRVGLVAVMVSLFVYRVFLVFPITFDTSAWYAGYGYAALLVVVSLALFGFRTALGDRPLMETLASGTE